MQVTGKQTTTNNIEVEIDLPHILKDMRRRAQPTRAEYLLDGKWYTEDYYDYHKREANYRVLRVATPEELELHNALVIVEKYVKTKEG